MKNRFAILDVFNGNKERTFDDEDIVDKFREGVGSNFLQWGAAYYPYLNSAVVKSSEVHYTAIANPEGLVELLTAEVNENLEVENITEARAEGIKSEINKLLGSNIKEVKQYVNY